MAKVGFGGGCHWCTEGVFQALRGVTQVEQGFLQSAAPADTWAEGVIVTFDPSAIALETLSEVHLRTHSATRARSAQSKYRSAIYARTDASADEARQILARFRDATDHAFVTSVLTFRAFKASDPRFHDYYARNREGPFCDAYIEPKLALLRQRFARLQKSEAQNA